MGIEYFRQIVEGKAYQGVMPELGKGRQSHCYLLVGADARALESLTSIMAATLFCGAPPCGECLECRKVEAKTHGNLEYFPVVRDKTKSKSAKERFGPEDARLLIERMSYVPVGQQPQIFVVRGFDNVSPDTQNKLLKTLEEPTPNTVIILQAQNSASVLNTIISRARVVNVDPLTSKQLQQGLRENYFATGAGSGLDLTDQEMQQRALWAAEYSYGSIDRAETMLGDAVYMELFEAVLNVFEHCNSSRDVAEHCAVLDRYKDYTSIILDYCTHVVRDVYMQLTGNSARIFAVGFESRIADIAAVYKKVEVLSDIQTKLIESKRRLAAHCGESGVVNMVLMTMMEGRAKCQK